MRINKFISTFVSILLAIVFLKLGVETEKRNEADKDCRLFTDLRNAAFTNDYYELIPDELDNPRFLFDFGKVLRMQKCAREMM